MSADNPLSNENIIYLLDARYSDKSLQLTLEVDDSTTPEDLISLAIDAAESTIANRYCLPRDWLAATRKNGSVVVVDESSMKPLPENASLPLHSQNYPPNLLVNASPGSPLLEAIRTGEFIGATSWKTDDGMVKKGSGRTVIIEYTDSILYQPRGLEKDLRDAGGMPAETTIPYYIEDRFRPGIKQHLENQNLARGFDSTSMATYFQSFVPLEYNGRQKCRLVFGPNNRKSAPLLQYRLQLEPILIKAAKKGGTVVQARHVRIGKVAL
ncbi:hypothetical protein BJ508DRAFT_181554 [Ascobolus immersus RN42]|uniref:Uncharacterized protein n=1 Tax=Ascobolus immersus RN42 TaxID=1160509 RepID=A0A3N4HS95_ASCIM|nr:hypothetical protein BJ508DRAFT_181554 [Ascobolus immersus RN42]